MRIFFFFCLLLSALFMPFWMFAVTALCYTFMWQSYEILILGVCVDAHFGYEMMHVGYYYTLTASTALIAISFIRPYLRAYT